MIKINGKIIELKRFPDGTLNLSDVLKEFFDCRLVDITWLYDSDEELVPLHFISKFFNENYSQLNLFMPYVPNARQDRIQNKWDVFTLKYFADMINDMQFHKIEVLDPHSKECKKMIKRLEEKECSVFGCVNEYERILSKALLDIKDDNLIVFFPDKGAVNKYGELFEKVYPSYDICYGSKIREWENGEITGLEIITNGNDLKGRNVLIIDDICSYGTTIYESAKKLKEFGIKDIYVFVTHCENSIHEGKLLDCSLIKKIYTTDTILTKMHRKINILTNYRK